MARRCPISGSWEIKANRKVMAYSIHVETTTMKFAVGLRNLQIPGTYVLIPSGMPFDHARNTAVHQFLQSPYEWLFSLDSDVICPPDTIFRLLAHNQPVVSGMYCRRSPPHAIPVALKDGKWLTNYTPGSVVEVDLVGNGCLLVHRSVYERVPPLAPGKPWYHWRVDLKGTNTVADDSCLSEDFAWNHHIRKHGYKIFLDTSLICEHVGLASAGPGTFVPMTGMPNAA